MALGQPGLSFRYVDMFGVSEMAYTADSDHINRPNGIGLDAEDNLWVAEHGGYRALKYNSAGTFQMSIGTAGMRVADEDRFFAPGDVEVDSSGNVWVADTDSHRVVKYNSTGDYLEQIGFTWNAGTGNDVLNNPTGIAFDSAGNMYIADLNNHRVQIFDSSGTYSTTLGVSGVSGSDNAHFNQPDGLAVDSYRIIYVADSGNHRVQIFDSAGTYSSTLGTGVCGSANNQLCSPSDVAVDSSGNIYVADTDNHRVQIFDSTGTYSATLGVSGVSGSDKAHFYWPEGVGVDTNGNVYVSDYGNFRVQKFNSSLVYQATIGTTGVPYLTDDYHFNAPYGVAVDASGNIILTEERGHRLLKLSSSGVTQWVVGEAGVDGSDNSHFQEPGGVATGASGQIYVADANNNRIQIFNSGGTYVTTLGSYGSGSYQFDRAADVAVGQEGTIYVADSNNHRVQIFDSDRQYVATLGVTGVPGSDNSHFNHPNGVAVGANGNIYVADADNYRIQVFDNNRVHQLTIGTTGIPGDDFDRFERLHDVAVDASGRIYATDRWIHRVQVFDDTGAYLTTIGGNEGGNIGQFRGPPSVVVGAQGNVYIADTNNCRIQKFAPGVPGWEQVNINGFGNRDNLGAWSLGAFSDTLYVGTVNDASGTEVYRLSSGSWEQVVSNGFDGANGAVDWFAEFAGHLYAGTWNDEGNGGQIWRSATGNNGSWSQVVNNGFNDATNAEVMTLAPFNGYLYAGTWSADTGVHGAEIWRSSTGDIGSWTQVIGDTVFGNSDTLAVLSFEEFNNYLYAATGNLNTGGEVWRTANGTIWTQANADGFGDADNTFVASLEVFSGQLYAGTHNQDTGGEIWRTSNGTAWSRVIYGGFADVDNRRIGSLVAFDGNLYAVVANYDTGLEVWRSSTGDSGSWKKVADTGFGGGGSATFYWDNATSVLGNRLYVGTYTWGNGGGRVWKKTVTADFAASPTEGPPPLTVVFTNTSAGDYTAAWWDYGDGAGYTGTLLLPSHVYAATGSYTVTLTVSDGVDSSTLIRPNYITVAPACITVAGVDLGLITAGTIYTDTTVHFSADIVPDVAAKPYTYSIDYDGLDPPVTATSSDDPLVVAHTFATTGTFTVEIAVWNCDMTDAEAVTSTVEVTVREPGVCVDLTGITIHGDTGGMPGIYTFTTSYEPFDAAVPINYHWDNGTALPTSIRSLGVGIHTLMVTATNCTTALVTDTHVISIGVPPPPGDIYELDDMCIEANAIPISGTVQVHSFHDEGDADWVSFGATAGVTCVVEVRVPPTSTADVTLELYDACDAGMSDESDPTFSPDIRLTFQPPADGTYYLKLSNTPTTTYGSDVVYHLSVRALGDNQPSGAVILVAGRLRADDELQANIHNVTNRVYEFALAHGCTADDVRYLATEAMTGVVGSPTKANLEEAITSWAVGRVGPDQPLTIYLMDHGTYDLLYLDKPSGEWITPGDLDGWLDSLGAEVPVNVVVEACYSGSFIDLAETVSGAGRVVIASTSNAAVAYATQEGASFSDAFLESLGQGTSLHSAFEEGHWAAVQGHPDQQPWLDDDGDGVANEVEDGEVAALRSLACETLAPAENWPPYVMAVAVEGLSDDQGEIRAQVQDDALVERVWVVIYPPSYGAPVSGEEMFGEPEPLVLEEHPTEEGWYTRVYTGFDELGEYRLVVHAEDDEAAQGRPKEKTVRTGWPVYLPLVLRNQ